MCDYCDCRSRALLADLGAQHGRITAAITTLRRSVAHGAREHARRHAHELVSLLGPHSELEERRLYPELSRAGVSSASLVGEHHRIDTAVRAAAEGGSEGSGQLLAALDELEAHIHREEYDLFPAAHQLLSDEAWDRIDALADSSPTR